MGFVRGWKTGFGQGRVFGALRQATRRYPNQRVGQIIANAISDATGGACDPFYVEDEQLAQALIDYARKPR